MLVELKVSNFAIINNIHIQFKDGLNILSGETGAGKSVLLKSLALLMGEKSSNDSIRTGATTAAIEGLFDLKQRKDIISILESFGIPSEDKCLIVRRVISTNAPAKVYLNGALSNLSQLKEIVSPLIEVTGHNAPLIEMTGQHENRNLLSKNYHLDLLDQYAQNWELRTKYQNKYESYLAKQNELSALESSSQNKAQRIDFLKFQINEISELDLAPGEDLSLEAEAKRLKGASKIVEFVEQTEEALYGDDSSAINRLNFVIKRSAELSSIDPSIGEKLSPLENARELIDESIFSLRQYLTSMDLDPSKLESVESRLSQLRKVQKKYGSDISDILNALVAMENELSTLENFDQKIQVMKKEIDQFKLELKKMSEDLHEKRSSQATKLIKLVNSELADLNMKGVTFGIQISKLSEFGPTGVSDVEFMTKSSAKDIARPLAKVASGGELSRILLSLKRVVGAGKYPRTYLFDEVDTGVSGETAEKVGRKLKEIASGQQVICVTHLPQVAAFGDCHFFINKSTQSGSANMEISELNEKNRVNEIARLISGEKITKTSLAHASELIKEAHADSISNTN